MPICLTDPRDRDRSGAQGVAVKSPFPPFRPLLLFPLSSATTPLPSPAAILHDIESAMGITVILTLSRVPPKTLARVPAGAA